MKGNGTRLAGNANDLEISSSPVLCSAQPSQGLSWPGRRVPVVPRELSQGLRNTAQKACVSQSAAGAPVGGYSTQTSATLSNLPQVHGWCGGAKAPR